MPILPTIPTLAGLSYPIKQLLGFAAKNSMQAQGKSEKEIIQDLVTKDNLSFYSWPTRDGGNEIDTYLYDTPYNTENTSNVGPSYENYLSTNFPLRKHAVKTYDAHFGDTLYIDQKYKDQVLDELEQGKTVGASMGRYGHAPSYIVNTKDDERRPYDAGGHLMQFQYDKDGNVIANMSDIYDFLPRDFEEKYGAIKEYGPLKTAGMYAMHYVGTPFIVRQNGIPVRFKEIIPEYKTELQSQLGNFLSNWGDMYDLTIPHRLTDEQIEEIFDGKQSGDEILDFMNQKGYLAPVFKKGGRIHIKKKNRGKFTAAAKRAGMGVQEFARHVLSNKDKYSSTLVKRANFARNSKKFKHENGGILKAQEGTGNGFWSKLWNAIKEGGMAARDAKLGAVGAQQVRDLYSEGKNQEAQDLAKQYAKANTTGIALAGGAASTGLLGDLMVTGATTVADTFIDGDTENFGKNLVKNTVGDLIGHGVFKGLRYFNGKPIFVKEMKNGIGDGLYHLDYGDAKGAFKSGSYIKNGYLYPGKTDLDGQLDYIWFNESKPYATAVRGKPFSRTIIFDQKDIPGILRVREQNYPIGQWNGKSGFVTKNEMVISNPIDMDNATVYKRIPIFNTWLRTK